MYKLIKSEHSNEYIMVLLKKSKLFIPFDTTNTDYQEYLKWLAEGNEPEPADE